MFGKQKFRNCLYDSIIFSFTPSRSYFKAKQLWKLFKIFKLLLSSKKKYKLSFLWLLKVFLRIFKAFKPNVYFFGLDFPSSSPPSYLISHSHSAFCLANRKFKLKAVDVAAIVVDDDTIIQKTPRNLPRLSPAQWWLSDLPKSKFICYRFLLLSFSLFYWCLPPCRTQIPQIFHLDCSDDNVVLALVENYWEIRVV